LSSAKPLEPTINVTPLVDVVLVLLIIFMVIAPALAQSNVELPKSATRDDADENAIHVVVPRTGELTIDGELAPRDALAERLQSAVTVASHPVIIEADSAIPYREIRALLDAVKLSGAKSVSLQVVEEAR
jgi:biopolymer transport protein TolR